MSLVSEDGSRSELRQLAADLKKSSADPSWQPPIESIRQTYTSLAVIVRAGSERDRIAAASLVLDFHRALERHQAVTGSRSSDWRVPNDLIETCCESLSEIVQISTNRNSIAASKLLLRFRQEFDQQREATA